MAFIRQCYFSVSATLTCCFTTFQQLQKFFITSLQSPNWLMKNCKSEFNIINTISYGLDLFRLPVIFTYITDSSQPYLNKLYQIFRNQKLRYTNYIYHSLMNMQRGFCFFTLHLHFSFCLTTWILLFQEKQMLL